MKYYFFTFVFLFNSFFAFTQMPTNGLISYYPFNGNANDENGGKNNGSVQGATLTKDRLGNDNSAYSFNGQDNLINLGANTSIRQREMTFSMWVKVDDYNIKVQSYVNQPFLTTRSSTSSSAYEAIFIGMHIPTSTFATATSSASGNQSVIISAEKAKIGEWFHLVYTFDDTVTKLYINCKLVGTSNKSYTSEYLANDPVLLGYVGSKSGSNFCWLNGCLDEIYIYDRVLDPSEFQSVCCSKNAAPISITHKDINSCQSTNLLSIEVKNGTPPYTYKWSNGDATATTNVTNTIPSNTNYSVTITDACGQTKIDIINVKLFTPSTATITATNPEFCAGGKTPIIVNFTGSSPWDYSYNINGLSQKNKITAQNPDTIFASKEGKYKLIELNKNICSVVIGEVEITQLPKIPSEIAGLDKFIDCKKDSVTIGTNQNSIYEYIWSNGAKSAIQTLSAIGDYYLTVVDSKTKCSSIDTVKVGFNKDKPLIKFNDKNSVNCSANKILIDASASAQGKQFTYIWQGAAIESGQNTLMPTVTKEGWYSLKILNEENFCFSKDSINITFCVPKIFAPNIFSPNDDGINDNFTLFTDDDTVLKISTLHIYNRWGSLVFSNKNFKPNEPEKGWDGSFKEVAVPKGVYTWIANVLLIDNSIKEFSGEILIF